MPKFICARDVISAEGDQEFFVIAENEDQARELFKAGKGEMYSDNSEVTALSDYDLDSIWED